MTISNHIDYFNGMERVAELGLTGMTIEHSSDRIRMNLDLLEALWAYRLSQELTAIPIEIKRTPSIEDRNIFPIDEARKKRERNAGQ